MEPFGLKAIIVASIMSSFLALRAYKRKSLTSIGSVAAFVVAFLLVGSGLRGFNLFTFYFVSIKATKYKVRPIVLHMWLPQRVWLVDLTRCSFSLLAFYHRKKSRPRLTEPLPRTTGARLGERARFWRVRWWPPYSAWSMPIFAGPSVRSTTLATVFCRRN